MHHFANTNLVARYGIDIKLTFMHYLTRARPTFAFITFLSDEMSMSTGSTISTSRYYYLNYMTSNTIPHPPNSAWLPPIDPNDEVFHFS